jgi:hypothetical protein
MALEFDARIEEARGGGAFVVIPFDVQKEFGTKGRVAIVATFDGMPYRGSLAPMGGRHVLGIAKAIREATGKNIGSRVHVTLEHDAEERTVEVPDDLRKALKTNAKARAAFEKHSYTRRKEMVRSLQEAKKPETRQRRLEKVLEDLSR